MGGLPSSSHHSFPSRVPRTGSEPIKNQMLLYISEHHREIIWVFQFILSSKSLITLGYHQLQACHWGRKKLALPRSQAHGTWYQ